MINFFYAYQPLIDFFLLNAGFALSQYIVLRAGVFSIATVGIVSIGAYSAAIVMKSLGLSIWIAAPFSALVGLAVGLLLSVPLARLRGPYQAIATLAFVQIVAAVALYAEPLTGGALGMNDIPKQVSTLGLVFALAFVLYILGSLSRSRIGAIFDALRQDEAVAGSLGISISFHHALAFALSGAIAGLFGALQAGYIYSIEPHQYGFVMLTMTLAAVILGGRRSIWGPVVGAAIMTFLPEIARPLAENRLLLNGLLLVVVIIFLPRGVVDGLIALVRRRRTSAVTWPAESSKEVRT
ncbi:branched-chain amino acid ABC transporter permease [Chelativorans sp. Marseille-P2723]|uniref:branched-chain amino acid ABC transporter permease n=1 Tax=Chelativorans sp. Marseille-P2723 TaxID=2709133 RepID=UPI00156D66FD|nr:branched-chain amino acid ABC transporter permease [Chelativorans sp. Marseille-P2723]